MIHYKCRQQAKLVETTLRLPERHCRLLKGTVYHTFREEILPNLPVSMFTKCFSDSHGRPTKDLQSMVGLFIFQALLDLTDAEAVEVYCFHDTFRYALDIPRDAYLSQRAYYDYRRMLLGEGHQVFEAVLTRISERLDFAQRIQRKDSTLVGTALKRMSKLELFRATIRKFLAALKKGHPIIFSRIPEEFRERYLPTKDSGSWFTGDKPSQYAGRLIDTAKDVLWLIERFSDHASVSALECFGLLGRLAREQIQVSDDNVLVELDKQFRGSALVNPHDPEARYDGHREAVGYHVQITESCSESKDIDHPKILTQVEVELANTPDVQGLVAGVERLEAAALAPEILLTDNGYASDDNHQALAARGVEHLCPPAGKVPDGLCLIDFALDGDQKRIERCPAGKPCQDNRINEHKQKTTSYFDVATCRGCPHSQECPVKMTKRKARLEWEWKRVRLEARRLQFAEDESVKKLFRQRSGGESPMSILKKMMGLERSSRRGRHRVTLAVFLAATGLNILRTHQWLLRKARRAMSGNRKTGKFSFLHQLFTLFGSGHAGRSNRYPTLATAWDCAA